MTETECAKKLEELDRHLNDPDIPMDPSRVWALLDELHCRESDSDGTATSGVDHTGLKVRNLESACEFFWDYLG